MTSVKKISIAITAAFGLTLLFCANPTDKQSLKWRSAMDFPVNVRMKLGEQIPQNSALVQGYVVMDVASGDFSLEDEAALVKKFENPSTEYHIAIENTTDYNITFYALLAPAYKAIKKDMLTLADAHKLITENHPGTLLGDDIISLFGQEGLDVPAGSTARDSVGFSDMSEALANIIIHSPLVAWRWLAKVASDDYVQIGGTDTTTAKVIDARVRLTVRGVNNMDSLLTSFE